MGGGGEFDKNTEQFDNCFRYPVKITLYPIVRCFDN